MRLKYAEDFYIRALLNKVKIKEIMSTPAISVRVDAPFRQVAKLLHEKRIRHLPVVNDQQEVVGLMTQRDLYKIQPPHKNEDGVWVYDEEMLDGFILSQVMVADPFTLSSEHTLAQAIEPMARQKYGCLPIVDKENKLCGIMTQYDLIKLAFAILQEGS